MIGDDGRHQASQHHRDAGTDLNRPVVQADGDVIRQLVERTHCMHDVGEPEDKAYNSQHHETPPWDQPRHRKRGPPSRTRSAKAHEYSDSQECGKASSIGPASPAATPLISAPNASEPKAISMTPTTSPSDACRRARANSGITMKYVTSEPQLMER